MDNHQEMQVISHGGINICTVLHVFNHFVDFHIDMFNGKNYVGNVCIRGLVSDAHTTLGKQRALSKTK